MIFYLKDNIKFLAVFGVDIPYVYERHPMYAPWPEYSLGQFVSPKVRLYPWIYFGSGYILVEFRISDLAFICSKDPGIFWPWN